MRIIIAGGRDFTNTTWSFDKIDTILAGKTDVTIIDGTALGGDRVGREYAKARDFKTEKYPADWNKYGKSAGYIRNKEMAGRAHALIAFWDGKSRGTNHMINLAKEKGLKVTIIKYKIEKGDCVKLEEKPQPIRVPTKFFWLDTETGGVDPKKHGIIQIGGIYESGKNLRNCNYKKSFEALVHPRKTKLTKEALKINKHKKKKIKKYPKDSLQKLVKFLDRYIKKFDRRDKLLIIGYNVKFDLDMVHAWAKRENFDYMGSYLDWRVVDVLVLARTAHALGIMPENPIDFKLGTICKIYGIKEPTHDAMADVEATRELFFKLTKGWK